MEVLKLETWINEFGEDQLNLNKLQEYVNFIVQAVKRYDPERYSEWHHVMPKCIDKERKFVSEGVQINGLDHVRAHRRLLDVFTKGPYRRSLGYALHMMLRSPSEERLKELTDEEYEEYKSSWAKSVVGTKRNELTKLKLSRTLGDGRLKGANHPMYGLHLSQETKDLISKSNKQVWTESKRREFSQRRSGEGNPCYGKKLKRPKATEESRLKMSVSGQGKVWINNGIVSTKIKSGEVPEGWSFGRVKFTRSSNGQEGKIWITNELVNKKILSDQEIPKGWRRGRCKSENQVD